jgi:hypothetical protein
VAHRGIWMGSDGVFGDAALIGYRCGGVPATSSRWISAALRARSETARSTGARSRMAREATFRIGSKRGTLLANQAWADCHARSSRLRSYYSNVWLPLIISLT